MKTHTTTTAALALCLSLFAGAACDPAAAEPALDVAPRAAKAPDSEGVLAAEHLAELSFDEGDIEAHMALWAPGELEFESPFGSFDDPAGYEAWIEGFYGYTQALGGTRHHVINPIVTIDGNEAEVTAYLHVVNRTDGSFMGSSVIHDRLVRTSEGWRFVYRSVEPDQLPGG